MAVEIDKLGSKRYTSPNSDVIRVVPQEGQEYTITPLPTEHANRPFPSVIFQPENPVTDDLTLVAYGLGENGGVDEGEAHTMAMRGIPNVLHDTPRVREGYRFRDMFANPRLIKEFGKNALNPLILPSEALSQVADTAQAYDDTYSQFILKVRSMGGLTGSMFAAFDDRVTRMYMDAPAGIVQGNAMLNHLTGLGGIATKEIPPAVRGVMRHTSKESMGRIINHFRDNPLLFGREIVFLVAKTPDISGLLEIAHDRGTDITIVNHELDQFFTDRHMVQAITGLMKRGIVDHHYRSEGTRHVFGIEKPHESAQLYYDLMMKAQQTAAAESQPQLVAAR